MQYFFERHKFCQKKTIKSYSKKEYDFIKILIKYSDFSFKRFERYFNCT